MLPLRVEFSSMRWACSRSLLGSFSTTSGRSPTTKLRELLTPQRLTRRTSWQPTGTLAATVTLNWVTETGRRGRSGLLGSGGGGGVVGLPSFGLSVIPGLAKDSRL